MLKLLFIAAGSAVGGVGRYVVSGWAQRLGGGSFPTGTLCVNVVGCFLFGLLAATFAGPYLIREEYKVALLIGVLGSFTTFSTFGYESFALFSAGQFWLFAVNVAASNVVGLSGLWLGYRLAERWVGT
jgi:CrcB protein